MWFWFNLLENFGKIFYYIEHSHGHRRLWNIYFNIFQLRKLKKYNSPGKLLDFFVSGHPVKTWVIKIIEKWPLIIPSFNRVLLLNFNFEYYLGYGSQYWKIHVVIFTVLMAKCYSMLFWWISYWSCIWYKVIIKNILYLIMIFILNFQNQKVRKFSSSTDGMPLQILYNYKLYTFDLTWCMIF